MHDDHPPVAVQLAGYRVGELLGRGGMGEVYRAEDVRLDRTVALKVLAAGPDAGEGLLQESRLAAALDHPNVVPIFEAGDDEGRLFIAMRYVGGGDLRALLRREGKLEPARALSIAAQVADALDAAHRRGLVHRDVKPSNVLIDRDDGREHCYLADFGLTRRVADADPADGHLAGTVAYAAPEQIRGDAIDGRADQYALACLLFECLTGALPFQARSDVAVIFAHLEEPPPTASGRDPSLPAGLDVVLARGMAKVPGERFESCGALVRGAAEALGLGAPPARPSTLRRLAPLALALVAVAAVVAAALARGGGGGAAPASGAIVRVDPASNAVVASRPVPGHPGELTVTPGGVWMADFRGGVLWRYEPGSSRLEKVTSNGEPRDLAALGGKVYVAADGRFLSGIVSRYDAVTGVREDGIDLLACAIASGEGVLWTAGCPFVQRLSTGDGRMRKLEEVFLPFRSPGRVENGRAQFRELAVGEGSVWVLGDALDRRMWQLDARTGKVQRVRELGFPPSSVAVGGGLVWVTDGAGDRVVPFAPDGRGALPAVAVGRGPSGIAVGAGGVWVANTLDGTIMRIDPVTRRVVATIDAGGLPRGVAVADKAVWVTTHAP